MFRIFTKVDGMRVFIKNEDIISYEEMEDHTLVITVIGDFEVIESVDSIFNEKKKYKF